jgi:hypothetical protein
MVFRAVAPRPKAAFFLMIMSAQGTKRTCLSGLTMSALEGRTDMQRKRGQFRF